MKNKLLKFMASILVIGSLSVATLTACTPNDSTNNLTEDKNNEQLVPTNPNGPSVDEPTTPDNPNVDEPTTPQQPTNPDVQNPEEKDPEEQNPSVDPQNPEEKDPEVNPQNPDVNPQNPDVNPEQPGGEQTEPQEPDVEPEQPENPGGQVDTENLPTAEDYVNFENKLKEVIEGALYKVYINEIVAYTLKDNTLSVLYDSVMGVGTVDVNLGDNKISTHDEMVSTIQNLKIKNCSSTTTFNFKKSKEDFTLSNGFTYSADEGYVKSANCFADLLGIGNPIRTYLEGVQRPTLVGDKFSSTNYSGGVRICVIYEENNIMKILDQYLSVDVDPYATNLEILELVLKNSFEKGEDIILGENLKPQENSQVEQLSNEYGVIFSKEELDLLEQVRAEIRFSKKPKKMEEQPEQGYLDEFIVEEINENKAE